MSGGVTAFVSSGPLLLALPVAAAAGAVTFLSPCVLPLVPGYLSYITGMSGVDAAAVEDETAAAVATAPAATAPAATGAGADAAGADAAGAEAARADAGADAAGAIGSAGPGTAARVAVDPAGGTASAASPSRAAPLRRTRWRAVGGAALFVLGFSALFASEGVAFGQAGETLIRHQRGLGQVLGALLIVLGLLFAGVFDRFSFAGRIVKPTFRPRAGLASAPILGVLFGIGWTPCIGPTLTAVLTLAASSGTAGRGALLAFTYGLGIGIPFLIVAFGFERGMSVFGFARRHAQLIMRIGGILLIVVGVLEVTGTWYTAMAWLKTHWIQGSLSPL